MKYHFTWLATHVLVLAFVVSQVFFTLPVQAGTEKTFNLHVGWNSRVTDVDAPSIQFSFPSDLTVPTTFTDDTKSVNGLGQYLALRRDGHAIVMVKWHKGPYQTAIAIPYANMGAYYEAHTYDEVHKENVTYGDVSGTLYIHSGDAGWQDGTTSSYMQKTFVFSPYAGYYAYVSSFETGSFDGPTDTEWNQILSSLTLVENDLPTGLVNSSGGVDSEEPEEDYDVSDSPYVTIPLSQTKSWTQKKIDAGVFLDAFFKAPTDATLTEPSMISVGGRSAQEQRIRFKGSSAPQDVVIRWAPTNGDPKTLFAKPFVGAWNTATRTYGSATGVWVSASVELEDYATYRLAFAFTKEGYDFAVMQWWEDDGFVSTEDWNELLRSLSFDVSVPSPSATSTITPPQSSSSVSGYKDGDLVKAQGNPAVYRMMDGKRQPFLNEMIFRLWYANFDRVIELAPNVLAEISLGAPVLPPAGTWIKIDSIPNVYEVDVDGRTLRWITSEDIARARRGNAWNTNIKTIDVTLYQRFTVGEAIR